MLFFYYIDATITPYPDKTLKQRMKKTIPQSCNDRRNEVLATILSKAMAVTSMRNIAPLKCMFGRKGNALEQCSSLLIEKCSEPEQHHPNWSHSRWRSLVSCATSSAPGIPVDLLINLGESLGGAWELLPQLIVQLVVEHLTKLVLREVGVCIQHLKPVGVKEKLKT